MVCSPRCILSIPGALLLSGLLFSNCHFSFHSTSPRPRALTPRPKPSFSETSASLRSAATGCHFTADNASSDIVPPSRPPAPHPTSCHLITVFKTSLAGRCAASSSSSSSSSPSVHLSASVVVDIVDLSASSPPDPDVPLYVSNPPTPPSSSTSPASPILPLGNCLFEVRVPFCLPPCSRRYRFLSHRFAPACMACGLSAVPIVRRPSSIPSHPESSITLFCTRCPHGSRIR